MRPSPDFTYTEKMLQYFATKFTAIVFYVRVPAMLVCVHRAQPKSNGDAIKESAEGAGAEREHCDTCMKTWPPPSVKACRSRSTGF